MDNQPREDPLQSLEDKDISPEEREQILRQIDGVIAAGRNPEAADVFSIRADRRGVLFPIAINLAALVLIALGVFLLFRHFELRREDITLRRNAYLSTESELIQALKQESASKLQAKEEEITSIQMRLQEMDRERRDLQTDFEANLAAAEQELRRNMESELEAEKERLTALGISGAEIDDRLREMESRQETSLRKEVEHYRGQLDARLQEKEQQLLQSRQNAEQALERARSERQLLAAAPEEAFAQEGPVQESGTSTAEQRLQDLNARLREESLFEDQVQALYRNVAENLESENYAAALAALDSLGTLFEKAPARVKETDAFLVAALKDFVRTHTEEAEPGIAGLGEEEGSESRESAAAELEGRLREKEREIQALQEQLRLGEQRSSADEELNLHLRESEAQIAGLTEQLRESRARVSELSAQVKTLQSETGRLSRSLSNAESGAFRQGRDDALRDIMTFLNYLSSSSENRAEVERSLLAMARQDPLYRAVTREIQILMAGGGSSRGLTAPYVFLGIVSSVSAGKIVIEAMVDVDVSVDSLVQVRRISDLEKELTIGEGRVLEIRGGKITATCTSTGSSGQLPAPRDMVYVEAGGSSD